MAKIALETTGIRRTIFTSEIDAKKAILLTFVAFLFTGFQCCIYGMLTVPVATHFAIDSNKIIFFDGFGLWGQILAMATGGMIIRKIKGKNTLIVAAGFMIVGSILSILAPNMYVYTFMTFLCNMAVGYVLISCNYMIMGAVKKEGESQGTLSILNVFFSLGVLISAPITGIIIFHSTWQMVFVVVMVVFVLFIGFLLSLNINELLETALENKTKEPKEKFLTPGVILTAVALFLMVYTEQIMNYFNQPHLHYDLKYNMELVGFLVMTYTFAQLFGRAVFGKFLLPKINVVYYIVVSAVSFAVVLVLFLHVKSEAMIFVVMAILGLCDSCLYPSILGFGMDQLKKVSSSATSFLVTVGAIGIPLGTSFSGIIGASFGRSTAMLVGPLFLIILAVIIFVVSKMNTKKA